MSPGVVEALSAAGRQRYEQCFSTEVVTAELRDLLRRYFDLPLVPRGVPA